MSAWKPFHARVPGKWVLAGEHAVLRGAAAVALPHPTFALELAFEPASEALCVRPEAAQREINEMLGAIAERRRDEGRPFTLPRGTLDLKSTIPVGAGLGSSAALCVALARWLAEPLRIAEPDQFEFARTLEHRFHGRSSGMDVAATGSSRPIRFTMAEGAVELPVDRLPRFTFHDTGVRGRTSDCVAQVEKFGKENPGLAQEADRAMAEAARESEAGLRQYAVQPREALERLRAGMEQGQHSFELWGLMPPEARLLRERLLTEGALAVKLTGAGAGGFLVALWPLDSPGANTL